jgi:pimeloyl-ACP methyl ester carboxylesterase
MAPVRPDALDDPALHEARRRRKLAQRARRRARWWYPLRVLIWIPALLLTALYLDQSLSAALIWPTQGASFVPLDQNTGTAPGQRDRMVIVAGGLNTKSGLSAASALAPSLGDSGTRLFSLRYGNGIYDGDIDAKFDALYQRLHPRELVLFGSSMGGDVVLNLAAHVQATYGGKKGPDGLPLLSINAIYLDSTPLGAQDVRYAGRTKAAAITDVTEALNTEGGGVTRLIGEVLATRDQWWRGGFPVMNLNVTPLKNKIAEVFRDKVTFGGISTQLVADQYGVIRRFDPAATLSRLDPKTKIVYFMPLNPYDDHVIAVEKVEPELIGYARQFGLWLTISPMAHGFHAAASFLPDEYNAAIEALRPPTGLQQPAQPPD